MMGLLTAWASVKRFAPITACALIAALIGLCSHFAHRATVNAQALRDQARQFGQAQALASQAAQAERNQVVAAYQARAKEAENAYQSEVADARNALGSYIAAHRLQPASAASATGAAGEPAPRGDTSISQNLPSGAVVVSSADLQACTDSVSYAQKAHEWALSLDRQEADDPTN